MCVPWGFSGGSDGIESACHAGGRVLSPGLGSSPGGRHGNPLQYSCLENRHGQRSLVGYSPWGCKSWTQQHIIYTTEKKAGGMYSKRPWMVRLCLPVITASLTFSIMKIYYFHNKNNNS